jgi:hypothetical protein
MTGPGTVIDGSNIRFIQVFANIDEKAMVLKL